MRSFTRIFQSSFCTNKHTNYLRKINTKKDRFTLSLVYGGLSLREGLYIGEYVNKLGKVIQLGFSYIIIPRNWEKNRIVCKKKLSNANFQHWTNNEEVEKHWACFVLMLMNPDVFGQISNKTRLWQLKVWFYVINGERKSLSFKCSSSQ